VRVGCVCVCRGRGGEGERRFSIQILFPSISGLDACMLSVFLV